MAKAKTTPFGVTNTPCRPTETRLLDQYQEEQAIFRWIDSFNGYLPSCKWMCPWVFLISPFQKRLEKQSLKCYFDVSLLNTLNKWSTDLKHNYLIEQSTECLFNRCLILDVFVVTSIDSIQKWIDRAWAFFLQCNSMEYVHQCDVSLNANQWTFDEMHYPSDGYLCMMMIVPAESASLTFTSITKWDFSLRPKRLHS
jgi:hypothetical protein